MHAIRSCDAISRYLANIVSNVFEVRFCAQAARPLKHKESFNFRLRARSRKFVSCPSILFTHSRVDTDKPNALAHAEALASPNCVSASSQFAVQHTKLVHVYVYRLLSSNCPRHCRNAGQDLAPDGNDSVGR